MFTNSCVFLMTWLGTPKHSPILIIRCIITDCPQIFLVLESLRYDLLGSIQWTVNTVQCTLYTIPYTLYSVHYTLYTIYKQTQQFYIHYITYRQQTPLLHDWGADVILYNLRYLMRPPLWPDNRTWKRRKLPYPILPSSLNPVQRRALFFLIPTRT